MSGKRIAKNGALLAVWIKQNLEYDGDSGAFYLRAQDGVPRVRLPIDCDDSIGRKARLKVVGKEVGADYVAFLLKTGNWPKLPVIHRNGVGDDLRWENLAQQRMPATDPEDEVTQIALANDEFLADLRRYHPNGPPTYAVRKGVAVRINAFNMNLALGGSPAALCADAI